MCRENKIYLIEDAAQAIGSKYKGRYLGTFGDVGCFSLAISKTISSGQGGFCVTNNPDIYLELKKIRVHGQLDLMNPSWSHFGLNLRFNDLQASIALDQLRYLEKRIDQQNIYRNYLQQQTKDLDYFDFIPLNTQEGEAGPYFDVKTDNLITLKKYLLDHGIETKRFYPSITTSNYLKIENREEIVNAHFWFNHGLILPSGPNLNLKQLNFIIDKLIEFQPHSIRK